MIEVIKKYIEADSDLRDYLRISEDHIVNFKLHLEWSGDTQCVNWKEDGEIYGSDVVREFKRSTQDVTTFLVESDYGNDDHYIVFLNKNRVDEIE